MKFLAGLLVLAACVQPYGVWADSAAAAAAAAASGGNGGGAAAAAAAAASSSDGNGAAAAAAAAAASSSPAPPPPRAHIPCNCNYIYEPVCGNDGRTYSNECVLKCISASNVANHLPAVLIKSRGECPRKPCSCPKILKQVCGSDGYTYANECAVNCENARRKLIGLDPISIQYAGPCRRPYCICSDVIIPVCGTDGRTYRNICVLQCVSRINQSQGNPPIFAQYGGACKKENCDCPPRDDPLCASDGNTYKNRCMLACQNRRRDQLGKRPLTVQYKGQCYDCQCPAIYAPVCAGGITFANRCILACTNKRRASQKPPLPPLKISNIGPCPCACKLIWDPLCATDERTYANICFLRCENKRRSDLGMRLLGISHRGRCRCDCSYCPRNYSPWCGSDSRTYWNKCWLNCNKACNSDIGRPLYPLYRGPC
ncbi:serine protease inhibitor dipetalogastin-like [Anticarsia gemmatalis]|uniref:serine protease inhibitor dipetalogastin-like n=1 Tax=Anticarsia gemmatalis TaxID=129554 RepID=UPI003F75E174